MNKYFMGYTKEVSGTIEIHAKNLKDAKKKFLGGDIMGEFDNHSNYIYDMDGEGEPVFSNEGKIE